MFCDCSYVICFRATGLYALYYGQVDVGFLTCAAISVHTVYTKRRGRHCRVCTNVYSEGLEKIPNPSSTRNRALASGFTVQRGLANRPHSREPPRMLYLPIRDLVCLVLNCYDGEDYTFLDTRC